MTEDAHCSIIRFSSCTLMRISSHGSHINIYQGMVMRFIPRRPLWSPMYKAFIIRLPAPL